MSGLIENARNIMDTAVDAERAGMDPSDWTILFGPDGGLEMIAGSDTPLDSLAWSRGASMAWQVKHLGGGVRVEGRATRESCRLEHDASRGAARMLFARAGLYQLIPAA